MAWFVPLARTWQLGSVVSTATSYLSAADAVQYVDWTLYAQLLVDATTPDGQQVTPLQSSAQVQSSPRFNQMLLAASGRAESLLCNAALGPPRYTVSQLGSFSGAAKEDFNLLLARLTACILYDRRPDKSPAPMPVFWNDTVWRLNAYATGDLEFQ